jgi:hypothetical protein
MNTDTEKRNKRLGIYFIIFAALQPVVFILAVIAFTMLPWLAMASPSEKLVVPWILLTTFGGWLFFLLAIILFIPALVTGIGIINRRSWGRIMGIVTAILSLFEVPLGTVLGIYALKVLWSKKAAD